MINRFGTDAARLMAGFVSKGNVGGFMLQGPETEILYALRHNGEMYCRIAKRPNGNFNSKDGWEKTESIPAMAEWIGQYRDEF